MVPVVLSQGNANRFRQAARLVGASLSATELISLRRGEVGGPFAVYGRPTHLQCITIQLVDGAQVRPQPATSNDDIHLFRLARSADQVSAANNGLASVHQREVVK